MDDSVEPRALVADGNMDAYSATCLLPFVIFGSVPKAGIPTERLVAQKL